MKTNGDDSIDAFQAGHYTDQQGYTTAQYFNPGLTKREYFAAMAMQGMLANSFYDGFFQPLSPGRREQIVKMAVAQAEALIKALNEGEK